MRALRRQRLVPVLVAVLVAAAVLWWLLANRQGAESGFPSFPPDSSATVMYAGSLPEDGALPGAKGLAIRGDRLYVAVSDANAIRTSRLDGSRPSTLTLPPAAEGVPAYPVDVAVLPDGRVAVVDTAGHRVLLLSESGDVETEISQAQGLAAPTAVEADDERLFIADGGDHTVKLYRPDGSLLRTLATDVQPPLSFVGGLASDGTTLWVSDSGNARAVAFEVDDGTRSGAIQQQFDLPRGVETWPGGLLVADVFGRTVTVTDDDGQPVDALPAPDGEPSLASPEDVAFDAGTGRAYVSDSVLGKVLVFNLRTAEDARGER